MNYITREEMEILLRDITQLALGYELTDENIPHDCLGTIVEWYKCGTDQIRKQISSRLRHES